MRADLANTGIDTPQVTGAIGLTDPSAFALRTPAGDPMTVLQDNYEALLDRPFTSADPTVYLTLLQMGVSDQVVVSLIAASSEYLSKVA